MKKTYFYIAGAVLALFVAGCGKSSGSKKNKTQVAGSVCAAGLVNTQYGCLQQGMCPAGQAQYNNGQCVAAIANNTQCAAGSVYSSQVATCLPQGSCPQGYGSYNSSCIPADSGYGYNNGYNNGYQYNSGYNFQYGGYNPYLPQQYNYNNSYYSNPYYNPYWTPQYYYY